MDNPKVVNTASDHNLDWLVPLEKSDKVRIRVYVNHPADAKKTRTLSVVQICRNQEEDGFTVVYMLDEHGNRHAFFPVALVKIMNVRMQVEIVPESAQKILIRIAESAMNILKKEFHPDPIPAGRCYDIIRYWKNFRKVVEVFESTDIVLRSLPPEAKVAVGA